MEINKLYIYKVAFIECWNTTRTLGLKTEGVDRSQLNAVQSQTALRRETWAPDLNWLGGHLGTQP